MLWYGCNPRWSPQFRFIPFIHRAKGKVVEPSVCKTDLPGASPGRASISLTRARGRKKSASLGDLRQPERYRLARPISVSSRGHRSKAGQRHGMARIGVRVPVTPLSISFHFSRARGRQQSAPFGSARYPERHRGTRPLYAGTSHIEQPCSSIRGAPGFGPGG
jgi:hypothetical protein